MPSIQGINYRFYHTFISEDMNGRLVGASAKIRSLAGLALSQPEPEDLTPRIEA